MDLAVKHFEHGLILSSQIELDVSFMRLMPCLLQFLLGFYTQLVPFLKLLDCILLLTSNLINCDSGLGHYFHLFHRQVKCQVLS